MRTRAECTDRDPGRSGGYAALSQPAVTVAAWTARPSSRVSRPRCCAGPTTCAGAASQHEHAGGKRHANRSADARFAVSNRLVERRAARARRARTAACRRRSSTPSDLEPEQRALVPRRGARLPRRVRRPSRSRDRPRLAARISTSSASTSSADPGIALELPDGRRELRVLHLGTRRLGAPLLDAVQRRVALVRTEEWAPDQLTIVAADLIEQELHARHARPRTRARRGARVDHRARRAREGARGRRTRTQAGADCSGCPFIAGLRPQFRSAHVKTRAAPRHRVAHTVELRRLRAVRAPVPQPPPARAARERRGRAQRHRACSCTTCCASSTPAGRATTPRTSPTCSPATPPTTTTSASSSTATRSAARRRRRRAAARTRSRWRASTGSRRRCSWRPRASTRSGCTTACSTPATTRPAGSAHERVADVPAAKVQAFVLDEAARKRGLRLRLRYEYLQRRGRRRSRSVGARRRRPRRDRGGASRRGRAHARRTTTGTASPTRRCARTAAYRSICRDSAAPRRARRGRVLGYRATAERTAAIASGRAVSRSSCRPSSSASARSRSASPPPTSRAARSTCSPTRPGSPTPTRRRDASLLDTRRHRRGRRDRLVALPRPGRAARAASSASTRGDRGLDRRRQQPAAARATSSPNASSATSSTSRSSAAPESMHTRWRAAARAAGRAHVGDRRRRAVRVGDRRRPARRERLRDGALGARADDGLPAVRDRAARTPRAARVDEHQRHVSELWARFAAVAAENPNAWSRTAYSPEEIRTVSPDNRMVCFPYPKRMCANIDVDQARGRCSCARTRPRAPPASPTTAWCSCTRRPRRTTTTSSPNAGRSPNHPAIAAAVGDALAAAGHRRSTTSPTSTSTRASRPRCRSRRARSASPTTIRARSRSPAASASRAVRSTTTRRTRSRAWSRCCARDPGALRLHDRARLVHHEARGRRLVGIAARARLPARRRADEPGAGRRAARAASPPGSSTDR